MLEVRDEHLRRVRRRFAEGRQVGPGLLGGGVERVGEQRLLVGVVLVEAAAVHPGALGDIGDRDAVECALAGEFEEGHLQAAPRAADAGLHPRIHLSVDR